MKITDFDARLLRYIMAEVGIDRHSRIELRRAFVVSVGRLALRHFRELDADDPDFVTWNGEHVAIGGHHDPEYRRLTKDRMRAYQRSSYFVRRYGAQVRHIVDWLDIATRHTHAWLGNVDDKGRHKKLMKCASIEQLHREAEKQFRIIAQQQPARVDTNSALTSTDIKWVANLGDDLHLVQLLSPSALDQETAVMGHCIGLGSYDARVVGDQRRFSYWSIRNNDGVPLATIEVKKTVVVQLSGRGNTHVSRPIREAVERYMETVGWTYKRSCSEDVDTGRLRRGTEYYRLQRMSGHPVSINDVRLFQRLADVDQIIIVNSLKEAAGLPHDAEVPRVDDPIIEVYHDGAVFIERVVEDPDAGDFDHAPPQPR